MRAEARSSTSMTLFSRFAFIFLSMIFLIYAMKELAVTVRFSSVALIAARIEQGREVPRDLVDRHAADADRLKQRTLCRSDLVTAGMTMVLYRYDSRSQAENFEDWAGAANQADDYMRFALRCMPGDANAWLRYAGIRAAIAENPNEIAALMHQSRILAPSDNHMLLARLSFWNSFTEATLDLAKADVTADLTTLLLYGDRCEAGNAFRQAAPGLRKRLDALAATLPSEKITRFSYRCPRPKSPVTGPFKML